MKYGPKISIVLPVWNGERYISEAIDSILKQTFNDFELIVVDDCSVDGTASIIKRYAEIDARVKVVTNNANRRLPASLNIGFSSSSGDYLTWTSDDNYLEENFLAVLYDSIDRNNVDIVYSSFEIVDENFNHVEFRAVEEEPCLLYKNPIGASFLYRREVHEILGGYAEDKFMYEDYDFWVRAYLHGFRFYSVHEYLYRYRIHKNSLTSSRKMPNDYYLYKFNLLGLFGSPDVEINTKARLGLIGRRREVGFFNAMRIYAWLFYHNPLVMLRKVINKLIWFCEKNDH